MSSRYFDVLLFDWGDTLMRVFPQYEGPMKQWPTVEAIAGVREGLEALVLHYQLVLATNAQDSSEKDIREGLDRVQLNGFFDRVLISRLLGYRKPSPEFYRAALNELNTKSNQACMIGNDFEADVLGANEVGMPSIWLNLVTTEKPQGRLHTTIHDMAELPAALRRLELLNGNTNGANP